jgi:hypothetical protein
MLDNNKNKPVNELVLSDSNNKTDATNNSTVEDTLFTANTYGENDVDMVQDIINDIIQKEDSKKDEIIETNNAQEEAESVAGQSKKEKEDLFLEEVILDQNVSGVDLETNNQSLITGPNVSLNSSSSSSITSNNQGLQVNSIELNFERDKNVQFKDLTETNANKSNDLTSSKNIVSIDIRENSSFSSTTGNTSTVSDSGKKLFCIVKSIFLLIKFIIITHFLYVDQTKLLSP